MSKNTILFLMIMLGVAGFWWLGQRTKTDVIPLSSLDSNQLEESTESRIVELQDGDSYDMEVKYVRHDIKGYSNVMLAYNGSIPGPVIKVPQNATITLNLTNNTEEPTLLHSHGLRLDNRFDGTHLTQKDIKAGETFSYTLTFPDAGMYWYHPHLREDKTQVLGLAGNFWVVPQDENYWSEVNREVPLILSDILMSNNEVVPFGDEVDHTLMGRYGNTMLVNGKDDYELTVQKGEVVRFYLTNSSNVRPFNFTIPGVDMKLVGGDSGRYEREEMTQSVIISPSERYIVEAYFDQEGEYILKHDGPNKQYTLGKVQVSGDSVSESYVDEFRNLRVNEELIAELEEWREMAEDEADKKLVLSLDMAMMGHRHDDSMPCHRMPDGTLMGDCDDDELPNPDPIEWEDDMPMMNRMSNTDNVTWQFIEEDTGDVNEDINWQFNVGDKVKILIKNDGQSEHPMQHPIHFHGQRFLVITEDGEINDNLVWKDTVLVPSGGEVEILLDVTNPGKWMAHCHIPEHMEAGMMLNFEVK